MLDKVADEARKRGHIEALLESTAAENAELKRQLEKLLAETQAQADAGDDEALAAIDQARETGNLTKLKALLTSRANAARERHAQHADTLADAAVELASVAYANQDWQTAEHWFRIAAQQRPTDEYAAHMLGNLDAAMASCRAYMQIAEHLAGIDPSNTEWQRDPAVSHDKLAVTLERQGDRTAAAGHFEAGHAITRRLLEIDPDNAQWRQDAEVDEHNLRPLDAP